ncbi:stage II sporulation protein R [Clostridioides difficile]|nr:stage II sporulation protein R [Clostridioides difficile]EGT4614249.1 stage II sporulation protein R [Clostridioides difficile]EGT4731845.1 stage II sporulation protein R [Clostridioides difficile]EGT4782197.1 stage II sporulation protein R [Clostridioides difficile]EGT5363123.1 stage II sporulation protein R [Clostridioides difficile]
MVSDWQGGSIFIYSPALSGKEELSMGEDKKANKKRKRIVARQPVQMIVSREYVGTQTVAEAFIPIISEDIRRKIAEGDTFDNEDISA